MIPKMIIGASTGLGMFLYGMTIMSSSLQKVAGNKMKKIIGMLTGNRIMAVLLGIFVTGIIQSSSATTVMVVGFVNASIMTLNQAIGVIMGANIGTTVTAQILASFKSLPTMAVGVGVLIYLITKNDKTRNIASILIGFGILFVGMKYMQDALDPLKDLKGFKTVIMNIGNNPLLGVLIGLAMTFLLQSSAASIGILLALATQGLLPIESALPLLYGDNIGTCTTALLSSIGASRNAVRAALMHLVFNVVGTLIFILFLHHPIIAIVKHINPVDAARQVANAHTIFNIVNVIIQLPFAGLIVKFVEKIIPINEKDQQPKVTKYIDDRILATPAVAFTNVLQEVHYMGTIALESFQNAMEGVMEKDVSKLERTEELEDVLNKMERAIISFLVKLSNKEIPSNDRKTIDALFKTVNDFERMGDHAENITELAKRFIELDGFFSEDAMAELRSIYGNTKDAVQGCIEAMEDGDMEKIKSTIELEGVVDIEEETYRENHMDRLHKGLCDQESGIIFLDILSNLERIADHSNNVVTTIFHSKGRFKLN